MQFEMAARNSSPKPVRWRSYHEYAPSTSAAAAGRKTGSLTASVLESWRGRHPRGSHVRLRSRFQRVVDRVPDAGLRSSEDRTGRETGSPKSLREEQGAALVSTFGYRFVENPFWSPARSSPASRLLDSRIGRPRTTRKSPTAGGPGNVPRTHRDAVGNHRLRATLALIAPMRPRAAGRWAAA